MAVRPPESLPDIGEPNPRDRIVAAARQHFFAHGFRTVTMADVARTLGMSKKTLYAHFASKDELLQAVILNKFQELRADFTAISARADADFSGTLAKVLQTIQQHTAEIQPPFIRDLRQAPDIFRLAEQQRRELIEQHLGGLFAAGRKANLIRKDISPRLITEIVLGVVQAIMNPTKMAELELTPKTGFTAILSVILNGVLVPRRGELP